MRSGDVPTEHVRHDLDRVGVLKYLERRGCCREMIDRFKKDDEERGVERAAGVEDA